MKYHVQKLADLDFYTEGPVVDRQGNLFFTTLSGGKILSLPANVAEHYVAQDTRPYSYVNWAEAICPNGQAIHPNGEHWVCESSTGQISIYSTAGTVSRVLVEKICAGLPFSTPNDLILDSNGNLYFTESVRENGKVFFVGHDGTEKRIADNIDYANGLALNATEDTLYVAESYGNRILAIPVGAAADITERRTFADLPQHPSGDPTRNLPDGLAVDKEGRVWVAHYGMQAIQVLSPGGELLFTIDTGLPLTSNLTFVQDSASEKKLLITGGFAEPGPGAVMLATVYFPPEN